MKNFKRLIVTLLALVLLSLNMTGFAYYTGDAVESDTPVKFETAVKTLYGLGVLPELKLDGYDENVTREDFAGYVRNFGGKSITVPVPADNDVTMGEAIKLIIQMSDNVTLAEYYGTYPAGYFAVASTMGVTYGLAGVQEFDKVTYGMAVQMLYNTLRVTPGVVNGVTSGGKIEYTYDANKTVLTEYLDVKFMQGFVTADSFWNLNPGDLPGTDAMVIDGELYRLKYATDDDYVGYLVNYYYHEQDDVILAVEKTSKAKQVVLRGTNITKFTANTYYYEVDGKETKYLLDSNVYIASNYIANMAVNVDMYPANADIVLVDADGNNKYETVLIKKYTEIQVQVLDVAKEQLISKTGVVYDIPKDLPLRIYSDGALVEAKSVETDDFATIVVDSNNDVREIYLSTDKVKGTVTSYAADARLTTVTVDGVEYVVSNSMTNANKIGTGVTATFIINFKGEISNIILDGSSASSSTTTALGYLIKMRKLETAEGTLYRAKILNENGIIESIDLIKDVKLNKSRVKEDIRGLLGASVNESTYEYNDDVTRQVIQYTLNADKKITKIVTALPYDTVHNRISSDVQYGDYKFHQSLIATNIKSYLSNFEYKIIAGPNTIVFTVPADHTDESDFNFSVGSEVIKSDTEYNLVAYNFERNAPFADVMVFEETRQGIPGMCGGPGSSVVDTSNSPMYMVTKTTTEYHEDYGVAFDMVEYLDINSGAVAKTIVADNALWTSESGRVQSFTQGSWDLKAGDLFHMNLNGLGEIGTVMKHYDASEDTMVSGVAESGIFSYDYSGLTGNKWRQNGKFFRGYPVASTSDYIVTASSPSVTFATAERSDLKFYQVHSSKTRVYKVKVNGNSVEYEKSTLAAITPSANGNSHSVIYTSNVQLYGVIVYE